jgi:chloramphenicol 3-O phosphotransferase
MVHAHGVYDVEVDTSVLAPEECADAVIERMQRPAAAFATLRSRS